jgi:hypothetical protein
MSLMVEAAGIEPTVNVESKGYFPQSETNPKRINPPSVMISTSQNSYSVSLNFINKAMFIIDTP